MASSPSGKSRSKAAIARDRPRIRDRERTRRSLIGAGELVFYRDGFTEARIEDIAAEAGVSRATFYLHFGSKDELAAVIMENVGIGEWRRRLRELNSLGEFTWDQLRTWTEEFADWYRKHASFNAVVTTILTSNRDFAVPWVGGDIEAASELTHYVTQHDGETEKLRVMVLCEALHFTLWFSEVAGVDLDRERLIDALTDVWWSVLRGGEKRD